MEDPIRWERMNPKLWTSKIGYVEEVDGVWYAHVYRNTSTGKSWTEQRPGFGTYASARGWVERNYQE